MTVEKTQKTGKIGSAVLQKTPLFTHGSACHFSHSNKLLSRTHSAFQNLNKTNSNNRGRECGSVDDRSSFVFAAPMQRYSHR
jgi:hypothetical protein